MENCGMGWNSMGRHSQKQLWEDGERKGEVHNRGVFIQKQLTGEKRRLKVRQAAWIMASEKANLVSDRWRFPGEQRD